GSTAACAEREVKHGRGDEQEQQERLGSPQARRIIGARLAPVRPLARASIEDHNLASDVTSVDDQQAHSVMGLAPAIGGRAGVEQEQAVLALVDRNVGVAEYHDLG